MLTENEARYTSLGDLRLDHSKLVGPRLILEPLSETHLAEFFGLLDPRIWKWYTVRVETLEDFRSFLQQQIDEQKQGRSLPFAIREKGHGRLIGGTRFLNIERANRRVEVGSTWFGAPWQRTFANSESKFLMLTHAFEAMGSLCVQFYTDARNEASRRAIERLGGKLDGILRNHRICFDGRIRDSAVYSIREDEWSEVKAKLQGFLRRS